VAAGAVGGKDRRPVSSQNIPLSRTEFGDAEARAVADVLASGWVTQGPKVAEFERVVAARVGAAHAVATTSCTTALHLALLAAGVGPGDEVICPSYSFIATANAVLYSGATPVFADIDAQTWNLDPSDVESRVTSKTRAVLAVHQVGLAADLRALEATLRPGISMIEDAACAIGSTYHGRPIGSHGHTVCFSFHPRKSISTGEGGMLTTDDDSVARHVRLLRSHGASVSDLERHKAHGVVFEEYRELGYNYRMPDIQGAIGIEQMKRLDDLLARRRAVAERYNSAFRNVEQIETPAEPEYAQHTYQSYLIRLRTTIGISRDELLGKLVERGISCRRGIPPIHLEPLYRKRCGAVSLPVTEAVSAESIFLPMFASLPEADQARVIDAVVNIAAG
jgi:dTDP-4-amino-4,6-dideoxygalactose transaminase